MREVNVRVVARFWSRAFCVLCLVGVVRAFAGPAARPVGDKVKLAWQVTEPKIWRAADGATLPYRLHLPAQAEAGRRYPLVIHMHGAGSRGTNNVDQVKTGGSDFLVWMTRRGEDCVFLAPQCPAEKRWVDVDWRTQSHRMHDVPTVYFRLAMEIIEDALTRYPVDRSRVYVMGISMGGYATWELLQRHPEWFAAALPCCGGGDVTLAGRMKDVAVWAFHGDADPTVPVVRSRSMVAALKAAGGKAEYREYSGVGHDAWTPTFSDDKVFDWMWRQRRQK